MAGLAFLASGCLDLGTRPWEPDLPVEEDEPTVGEGESAAHDTDLAEGDSGAVVDDTSGSDPADEPSDEPADACPHPGGVAETVDVLLINNSFQPPEVWVCAGDSLVWTNQDTKEHTIFTGKPFAPDGQIQSHQLYYGASFTWTFSEPGSYEYYCSTHKKKMQGAWVHVE